MAKEVSDASRTIPWAIHSTLTINGITGLIMAITFAYCLGPVDAALVPKYNFAYIGSFLTATQSHTAIGNMATASRQMFAFARDKGLPFAPFISYIRPGWDIPVNSILITFVITALLSLINLGSTVAFNALLSIGVVALLTSYITSISCILLKRIRGEELLPRRWNLGAPLGWFFNIIGLSYVLIAFVFAFFPLGNYPTTESMNWASAAFGGVAIIAPLYYFFYARYYYVPPVSRLAKNL